VGLKPSIARSISKPQRGEHSRYPFTEQIASLGLRFGGTIVSTNNTVGKPGSSYGEEQ
jgi:hypothetical protein